MASSTPPSQSPSSAPQSASSTQPNFQPRQEFIKTPIVPHNFGLVSFNGSEILRLANFPVNVVNVIRKTLKGEIRHYREDTDLVVSELVLAGKPFSGRSARQEQILLAIFTAIFSQQYYLLSSIDYGRIYLDKLTLAFARALVPASGPQPERRVAFGISFSSMTQLRVVSPPLSITPAILQVVRSAWPHGVISEKRNGDACYTFKLKGYSLFQHSTFEVDSLTHILEILKAMDAHGITLVTSINLAKRSRIQDFWVFSAPAPRSQSEASPIERINKASTEDVPVDNSDTQSHSMILDEAARKAKSSTKPNPKMGHSRSSSQPDNSPPPDVSHARNATLDGGRRKGNIPPPLKEVPRDYARQQTSVTPFPRDPHDDPRKYNHGPLHSTHSPHNLPPEFPPYPPETHSTNPYPINHELSVPQIIYTSPSHDHEYRTVPSGAFRIQPPSPMNPEPSSEPRAQVNRAKSWSTQGEFMPDPPDDDEDFNPGLLPSTVFRDTRLTEDTWAPSNDVSSTHESAIAKLAQTTWTKKGPMKSTTTIEPILEQMDGEAESVGLARSPKQVDPELYPEDPGQLKSECASLDYIPPPVVDLPADPDQSPKDKSGARKRRVTTEAAAAEVLSKSRHRATAEIPMTVRNSDNIGPGGHWVLIHEPGTVPTSKDIPLPTKPLVHPKSSTPLKVIPAATARNENVIPSDGDQSAYPRFPPVKDKAKKSVFPWSRSRKNSRDSKTSKKETDEQESSPKSRFKEIDPVFNGDEVGGQIVERERSHASRSDSSISDQQQDRPFTPVVPITPSRSQHNSRPESPESHGPKKLRSRRGSRGPFEVGVPEKRLIID